MRQNLTRPTLTSGFLTLNPLGVSGKNAATNPEHMAAVQLTREILQSDDEDWKSWALNFTTTQGDKPYSVADLMEKIVSQDKLRTAGGKPKKESALLAIKDGKARE